MSAIPGEMPEIPVPTLRPDLELFRVEDEPDGSPSFVIHDPLTASYRKIGWREATVLNRMNGGKTINELLGEIREHTTLELSMEELLMFLQQARAEGLTLDSCVGDAAMLERKATETAGKPHRWLLTHLMFVRIPLFNPDAFLNRTVRWARLLVRPFMLVVYALCWLTGLYFLSQHWGAYRSTFTHFFSAEGLVYYALMMIFVKAIHEFSHAFTAKAHGVRVPLMGVALIVFWPLAFCDVTDGWRLPTRRQRFRISVAGMTAEIILGGIALAVWGLTSDGMIHSIAFFLSSVTLISTLLVNLNPGMRFDGYYILSDLWGIDNLQQRGFAMARWQLKRWFLGLRTPPPELAGLRRRLGMLCYASYATVYRAGVYFGIAIVAYHKFDKVLGIVLFLTEVGLFLIRPVVVEIFRIYGERDRIGWNRRSITAVTVLTVVFLWAALPLPRRLAVPAVAQPVDGQVVYAPHDGIVQTVEAKALRNREIDTGFELATIRSPGLETDLRIVTLMEAQQVAAYARAESSMLKLQGEELEKLRSRLRLLREQNRRNRLVAERGGVLVEWDKTLHPGQSVTEGRVLGRIASHESEVIAFLPEYYVNGVEPGDAVTFYARGTAGACSGNVRARSRFREETLEHLPLSSELRGELPVQRGRNGELKLVGSYYRVDVSLKVGHDPIKIGETGTLWLTTPPRSLLAEWGAQLMRVILRESGF